MHRIKVVIAFLLVLAICSFVFLIAVLALKEKGGKENAEPVMVSKIDDSIGAKNDGNVDFSIVAKIIKIKKDDNSITATLLFNKDNDLTQDFIFYKKGDIKFNFIEINESNLVMDFNSGQMIRLDSYKEILKNLESQMNKNIYIFVPKKYEQDDKIGECNLKWINSLKSEITNLDCIPGIWRYTQYAN